MQPTIFRSFCQTKFFDSCQNFTHFWGAIAALFVSFCNCFGDLVKSVEFSNVHSFPGKHILASSSAVSKSHSFAGLCQVCINMQVVFCVYCPMSFLYHSLCCVLCVFSYMMYVAFYAMMCVQCCVLIFSLSESTDRMILDSNFY